MESEKPEETTPETPAIVAEPPKKRPWLKIAVVIVALVVIISAAAYLLWPRNRAPAISQASVSSQSADVGQALTYTAQASDPDGDALTYTWNFGDNATATGASVTHAYTLQGRFITLLTVSDGKDAGTVTNDNSLLFIGVSHPVLAPSTKNITGPAAAVLSADGSVVKAGDTVHFNGNSSWAYVWEGNLSAGSYSAHTTDLYADMFTTLTYAWGDGSAATAGTTTEVGQTAHTFASVGNYFNKLTVAVDGPSGSVTGTYGYTVRVQAAAPVIQVKNPDIFTEVSIGEPQYLDPATDYETAGGEVLQNVYETLVWYQEGSESTSILVPRLATAVPTVENSGISADGMNYTFHLRSGVTFHDGTTMTSADVNYSINRVLAIHDPNGPSWMLEQIMTNYISYYVDAGNVSDWVSSEFPSSAAVPATMRAALPAEANWATTPITMSLAWAVTNSSISTPDPSTVVFHLTKAYPAFLQVMAFTIGSVVSKATVEANGKVVWGEHNTWMDENAVGTGPFKLTAWVHNQVIVMTRYDGYWRTPAVIKQVNIVKFNDIASREFALLAGDADIAYVGRNHQYDILNTDGTLKYDFLNVTEGKPTFNVDFLGFNQNISTGSLPDPLTIPTTFFADINIRKAFSYAFDYQSYITNVFYGGAVQLRGPVPMGMAGYNASTPLFTFDLAQAKAALQAAPNPNVAGQSYWQTGFEITLYYNAGNDARQEASYLLQQGLTALNAMGSGLIKVNTRPLDWPVYLDTLDAKSLPIFFLGWAPDYADADDYVMPFLYSRGLYPSRTSFKDPALDTMILAAASELNTTKRTKMYEDIQSIAVTQDVPFLWLDQATQFHVQRAWVNGWYWNPMLSGQYFYLLSKG